MSRTRGFKLGELVAASVAVGLLLLLFIAVGTPSLSRSRETANRVKCSSNLREIGLAAILYANDNGNAFPQLRHDFTKPPTAFTGWDAADPWTGPAPSDVTAAWYSLLRTQDIKPGVFVCPSEYDDYERVRDWDFGGKPVEQTSNFPHAGVISYSFQNPYSQASDWKWDLTLTGDFAIASDRNPGGPAVVDVDVEVSSQEVKAANSPNHRNEGQNILYADGHVTFENTPFAGIRRDNIFTTGRLRDDDEAAWRLDESAVGYASDHFDSVLLPAAADYTRPPLPFLERRSTHWAFNTVVALIAIAMVSTIAIWLHRLGVNRAGQR